MKIRVQRRDECTEIITLVPPIEIQEPFYEVPEGVSRLTHFHCGDGTDHFFTQDGYYDGWGRGIPEGVAEEEAIEIIKKVEESREIEPPEEQPGASNG